MVPVAPAVAAAVAARRARLVRTLIAAGALNPSSARTLDELGISNGLLVRRMLESGVLKKGADERIWLDQVEYDRNRRQSLKRVMIVVLMCMLILGFILVLVLSR